MMDREVQIANWEKDLATIINKTNKNIQHVSNDVRSNSVAGKHGKTSCLPKSNLPIPPPMSLLDSCTDDSSTCIGVGSSLDSHTRTHHYKRVAKEAYHCSRGVGVTRPLPKHVEDDLTTRIGHSIRISIERAMNEKNLKSQLRLDGVRDHIDSLHMEMERVHKVYGNLNRSVSSQERVTKWLRKEAGCQKDILEKIQNTRVEDEEWKEIIQTDLDVLGHKICKHEDTRATNLQLKAAMNSMQTNSKHVINDAFASMRGEMNSEMISLRADLNSLRNENASMKETLRTTQEAHKSLVATLDNGRIREIVSSAVQPQICKLEEKITSTIKPRVEGEIRALYDAVETNIKQKQNNFWKSDMIQQDAETFNILSSIMLRVLQENKDEFTTDISTCILMQILNTNEASNCDNAKLREKLLMILNQNQDKHIKSEVAIHLKQMSSEGLEEVETKLTQRINREVEDLKREKCEEINKAQEQATEVAITYARSRIDEKLKDILPGNIADVIEPKLACLNEKFLTNCSMNQEKDNEIQKIHELEKKLHILSSNIDTFMRRQNNKTEENSIDIIQLSLKSLKDEISTIQNIINIKCEAIGKEIKRSFDSDLKHANTNWEKEINDVKAKLHITYSLCQTLRSSLEVSEQPDDHIEVVENKNSQSIRSDVVSPESDFTKQIHVIKSLCDDNKKEIISINVRLIPFDIENRHRLSITPDEVLPKIDLSNEISTIKGLIKENKEEIKSNNARFIFFKEALQTEFSLLQQTYDSKHIIKEIRSDQDDELQRVSISFTNMKYKIDINSKEMQNKVDEILLTLNSFQSDIVNAQTCITKLEIFAVDSRDLSSLVENNSFLSKRQGEDIAKLRRDFSGLQGHVNDHLGGNHYDSILVKNASTSLQQVNNESYGARQNIDNQSKDTGQNKIINNKFGSKKDPSLFKLSDSANKSEKVDVSSDEVECWHESYTMSEQKKTSLESKSIPQNERYETDRQVNIIQHADVVTQNGTQVSLFANVKDNTLSVKRDTEHLKENKAFSVGIPNNNYNCENKEYCGTQAYDELCVHEHLHNSNERNIDAQVPETPTLSKIRHGLITDGIESIYDDTKNLTKLQIAHNASVSRTSADSTFGNFSQTVQIEKNCEMGGNGTSCYSTSNISALFSIHTIGSGSLSGDMSCFDEEENISPLSHNIESLGKNNISICQTTKPNSPNKFYTMEIGKEKLEMNEPKIVDCHTTCAREEDIDIIYNYEDTHSSDQSTPLIDIEESLNSISENNDSGSSISKCDTCMQYESNAFNVSEESMYNSDFESEIEADFFAGKH